MTVQNKKEIITCMRSLAVLYILLIIPIRGAFSQTTEYELKAVAFQKISLFIDWPGHALDNPDNEFTIAVFGKNPFGTVLENTFSNVKIKNKAVKVVYFKNIEQINQCHLLFIPKVNQAELARILNSIRNKPVLTIADTEGYAEAGCLINFYNYSGKLRFEINQKALESAGFKVDFKLLNVSKIVNPVSK
jgi:hypothetical protein